MLSHRTRFVHEKFYIGLIKVKIGDVKKEITTVTDLLLIDLSQFLSVISHVRYEKQVHKGLYVDTF